jgi:hypothetical protein
MKKIRDGYDDDLKFQTDRVKQLKSATKELREQALLADFVQSGIAGFAINQGKNILKEINKAARIEDTPSPSLPQSYNNSSTINVNVANLTTDNPFSFLSELQTQYGAK